MIRIDAGVPIPEVDQADCGRGKRSYPWPRMEVGDSFFIPRGEVRPWGPQTAGANWCERNRPGCTVIRRTVPGGYRYWMVAKSDVQ